MMMIRRVRVQVTTTTMMMIHPQARVMMMMMTIHHQVRVMMTTTTMMMMTRKRITTRNIGEGNGNRIGISTVRHLALVFISSPFQCYGFNDLAHHIPLHSISTNNSERSR